MGARVRLLHRRARLPANIRKLFLQGLRFATLPSPACFTVLLHDHATVLSVTLVEDPLEPLDFAR